MGHLDQSVDVRASRLEATIPGIIERAITIALMPLRASIDALLVRVEICEKGQGATEDMRKDVDQLKSTDMSLIFGNVEIHDYPSANILAYSELPSTTARDDIRTDVAASESEAETNEDISMVGSSGAKVDETPGTDAQPDEVTEMQTSPQS
ncbi:hypothetical protein H5410_005256 [Solanum commersonii]|uniref:Polyprotein protein n=1 Tax=Solanum commersonii TaxID=4109 RepID=A0A9J6A5W9_SOLCO|nr:hypothetical protein H5410_005256 [Solanum commersonii]